MNLPFRKKVTDAIRDVFDANTAADQQRRISAGQAADYRTQQQSMGNKGYTNPVTSIAYNFAKPVAQAINTGTVMAGKAMATPYVAGDLIKESIVGTDQSYQDKLNKVGNWYSKAGLGTSGGLLGVGTTLQDTHELNNPSRMAGSILETGTNIGSVIPVGGAAVSTGRVAVGLAGMNAGINAASDIGTQLRTNGTIDNPGSVVTSAAIGAALPIVSHGAGNVVKYARTGAQRADHSIVNAQLPENRRMSFDDRMTLSDYADYVAGRYKPADSAAHNKLISDAWNISDRLGLNVRNNSRQGVQDEIANYLDAFDSVRSGVRQRGAVGGSPDQTAAKLEANLAAKKQEAKSGAPIEKTTVEKKAAAKAISKIDKEIADTIQPGSASVKKRLEARRRELVASDKPKVTMKTETVAPEDMEVVNPLSANSIDKSDPFQNRRRMNKIRNELGGIVDDDSAMIAMLRKIERETGQTGLVDRWYADTNGIKQSTSRANSKISRSKELKEAFGGMSGKEAKEFDDYAAARAELFNYEGMKTSKSKADLQAIYDAGHEKYGARFDAMKRDVDAMTDDLLDAGIIDKKTAAAWKKNKDYARVQRDIEDLYNPGHSSSQSRSFNSTKTAQKRKGSSRDILSPSKQWLKRRQELETEIARNKAATDTIDMLEASGLATKKSSSNPNTISRRVNGKVEYFEVHKDIKKVVENVNPVTLGVVAKIVSAPTRAVRLGLTGLNPAFATVNYLRDQASSAVYSKDVLATHNPKQIVSGLWNASKAAVGKNNDPLWKKFEEFTGNQTVYDELRSAKTTNHAMRELRGGAKNKVTNIALSPVRTLEDLVSISEKATRFQNFRGIYQKAIKQGKTEAEALQDAYIAASQNSVDFTRSSAFTRTMNLVLPFFNASVQGSRNVARSFRDRPIATSMKSIGFVALPSVAATMYNMSDPDRREAYESINQYEKDDNLIIVTPWAEQDATGRWQGIIKIPKPQGYRELTDPISDVTEAFMANEPVENVGKMFYDMLGGLTGPVDIESPQRAVGSIMPQQIKPTAQEVTNTDFYSGNKIVPQYMKEETEDPTKRAYPQTSGSARMIADKLNISPIQVEKFTKDTFGATGQHINNAVDNALAKAGKIPQEQIGGKSITTDIRGRLTEASGELLDKNKSSGRKYFETVDTVLKDMKLNKNEQSAFNTIHPQKTNFLGEQIFDDNKRIAKYTQAGIYLNSPKVLEADARIDAANREQGKPGNPMFRLPKDQLTRVLLKAALPPGASDPELDQLYKQEWYQDYQNERTKYYSAIKDQMAKEGKEMPASSNTYPQASAQLSAAMDQYSALPKGTGARSAWINSNPELWKQMTDNWSDIDAWENKERVNMGLSAIVKDDSSTSGYSRYGSGGGGSNGGFSTSKYYGSASRSGGASKPEVSIRQVTKLKAAKKTAQKPSAKIVKSKV